jgi:HEAT repeat protein
MGASRAGRFTDRNAIFSLTRLNAGDDVVVPYLVEQLGNKDHWTRHDAIISLGSLGGKASSATAPLTKLLGDEDSLLRLKAAKALFLITGDAAALEMQLDGRFAGEDLVERRAALETLTELGRPGGRFARYALAELRRSPPVFAEKAIEALAAAGTDEAVAALRATAESPDWKLRSQAVTALKQIEKPGGKGGH